MTTAQALLSELTGIQILVISAVLLFHISRYVWIRDQSKSWLEAAVDKLTPLAGIQEHDVPNFRLRIFASTVLLALVLSIPNSPTKIVFYFVLWQWCSDFWYAAEVRLRLARLMAMDVVHVIPPYEDATYTHQLVCRIETGVAVGGLLLIAEHQLYFCPDRQLDSPSKPFAVPVANGFQPEWLPPAVPNPLYRLFGAKPTTRFRYRWQGGGASFSTTAPAELLQMRFNQIAVQTSLHPSGQPAV